MSECRHERCRFGNWSWWALCFAFGSALGSAFDSVRKGEREAAQDARLDALEAAREK